MLRKVREERLVGGHVVSFLCDQNKERQPCAALSLQEVKGCSPQQPAFVWTRHLEKGWRGKVQGERLRAASVEGMFSDTDIKCSCLN